MQSRRSRQDVADSLRAVIPPASIDDPLVTVLASMAGQSTPQGGGLMKLRNGWRPAMAAATVVLVAVGGAYAAGAMSAPAKQGQTPVSDTESPTDLPDEVEDDLMEPTPTLVGDDDDADDQGEDADDQGEDADDQGEDADDQGQDADDQGEDAHDQGEDAEDEDGDHHGDNSGPGSGDETDHHNSGPGSGDDDGDDSGDSSGPGSGDDGSGHSGSDDDSSGHGG